MKKKQKNLRPKVLFNASVVLAGIHSPKGGSAKVLKFIAQNKIEGIISEIIFDEILRHSAKLGIEKDKLAKVVVGLFKNFLPAPDLKLVDKYKKEVMDEGDCHVLASTEDAKADYLVTLDKKHLLVLKGKLKNVEIVTPGELIFLIEGK
jgi:putative PIN family toxin of toxin-antitoxin system